jgi:hypothetical protein
MLPAALARPNIEGFRQMDAERINLIGTNLADLQARTADLRRYL